MTFALTAGGRRYGFRPSPPDYRDLGVTNMPIMTSARVVLKIDLEDFCGPVKDQGSLGACTAFAGCGMREFLIRKFKTIDNPGVVPSPVFSPLFLYYKERELDGDLGQGDTGSFGRTSVKAMNQFGVCQESADTYDPANMDVAPTTEQLADALRFKSGSYHSIGTLSDMLSCLASGYVFVLGFTVYQSFEDPEFAKSGIMPVPDTANEQVLGGHEVLAIGYDHDTEMLKIRNSWGSGWGQSGNFWMPYKVAGSPMVSEAWIQHLGKAW